MSATIVYSSKKIEATSGVVTPQTITLVTATQGTWTSGGLVAVNAAAGEYELHSPNAAQTNGYVN